MDDRFYFDKIRSSVAGAHRIVVQGCCAPDFMEKNRVSACLLNRKTGEKTELPLTWTMTQAPINIRVQIDNNDITKMVAFLIDLPEEYDYEGGRLRLLSRRGNDTVELYGCSGKKAKQCRDKLNYFVDSVMTDGKYLVVKGWAIDREEVKLTLKNAGTGEEKSTELIRYMRSDILNLFPECSEERSVGFILKLENNREKMQLYLDAGEKSGSCIIRGLSGIAGTGVVNNIRNYTAKGMDSLKKYGVGKTYKRVMNRLFFRDSEYRKWLKKYMPGQKDFRSQRGVRFAYEPVFSIVVPLYETDERFLNELVESVQAQTYGKWELCFSDGSRDSGRLREIISRMSVKDARIKYTAEADGPLGISENTNQALSVATGDYIVLGDHDDLFTPNALFECVRVLNEKRVDVIYTDEDKVDMKSKRYFDPHFKPDFNLDFLRSNNYICHMFVVSKALVDRVGYFREDYDGAQDFDFILRCTEQANEVRHIPMILYRWRSHSGSTASTPEVKMYAYDAGRRALEGHYERQNIKAHVEIGECFGYYKTTYEIQGSPLVSIIIPNRDHAGDLRRCITSIERLTDYTNYEIIIVENNSTEAEIFDYYKELGERDNIRILNWKGEFNYSAINNYGAGEAEGEYLLFLNNDTEVIGRDWLSQMLGCCQREDVGVVGARLYYADDTLQHAGVILGLGGIAGHIFATQTDDEVYRAKSRFSADYSAVTAACMMTSAAVFAELGGFEEKLAVALNDIDYCMKAGKMGRLVVYNANARLYHYESKSRGLENSAEKQERFRSETAFFMERWGDELTKGDPCYNVNLSLSQQDYTLKK